MHPTVPANSMVADINIDMFLPLFPLKVLTVYGLQESDLGDMVTKVANRLAGSAYNAIRSRCETFSSAAISTALFALEFHR